MLVSIKNISNLVDISPYKKNDEEIISSKNFIRNFGMPEDHIEQHIYSVDGNIIYSDYDYKDYKIDGNVLPNSRSLINEFMIDPGFDLQNKGFNIGTFQIQYNILRKKISSVDNPFYIKEISQDRKEIRVCSNVISDIDIENSVNNFIAEIQNSAYYKDFLINFGDNKFVTAVNIALDKNTKPISFLIKLYEPLSDEYFVNQIFSIEEELSNSYAYEVELSPTLIDNVPPYLHGPNFDIELNNVSVKPSEYFNIKELFKNDSNSSYQQILNKISNKNININVDYSDYSNFVHFSSAKERLLNFVYKLKLIETYESDINLLKNIINYSSSLSVSSSIVDIQNQIDNLITKFDDYDKFLYYESSSASWPKSGSSKPYQLYNSTSSISLEWLGSDNTFDQYYGGQLYSASIYDSENQNNLVNSIPEFIKIDSNNEQYLLFVNMIGQHYDNVWIYIDAINKIYKNTNSFDTGISKDLVFTMLNSLGVKLYNSKSNENIFEYLLGTTNSGSYLPTTSSYENLITASLSTSGQDQQKELFKRIYHNIPLLLKSKGTTRGFKDLITTFGISDTILDVIEYGGSDKSNSTYEYSYDRFSYSVNMQSGSVIQIPWVPLTQNYVKYNKFNIVPDTIEVRFKPSKLNPTSSTILCLDNGIGGNSSVKVELNKSNDEYTYDTITLKIQSGSSGYYSSSISVPVYTYKQNDNYDWWNLMLKRRYSVTYENINTPQYYDLYIKNSIDDNIGHQYSCSIYISGSDNLNWGDYNNNYVSRSIWLGGLPYSIGSNFVGNFQEFRYWSAPLDEIAFDSHVMNPESIEGNNMSSSYLDLAARFPLGNNLFTYNHYYTHSVQSSHIDNNYFSTGSINTMTLNAYGFGVYGSALYGVLGSSFGSYSGSINSAYFINFPNRINYDDNIEKYYVNSTSTIYSNPTTDKIRIPETNVLSNVLLLDSSIEEKNDQYTKDIHFTDISFSPQNEINKDIISQYGRTIEIDQLIGNPSDLKNDFYSDLQSLNKNYNSKYSKKLNYKDFIRLVKYFDNSLFKMLKDFTPARTNLSTGLTIKSPILERNKTSVNNPIVENEYNHFSASVDVVDISYEPNLGIDDKSGIYGELTGSILDVNDYFINGNNNPYALFKEDFDINRFKNDNYNCQLGVSNNSITSSKFKKINQYDNSILEDVELQDYNYELQRSIRPRYEGSKMIGDKYNFYTEGDITYGKEPVIKNNVGKLAWVKNIPVKSLNFNDKTSLSLKYLIDADKNLLELNSNNNNIFEVQNIFKSGDPVILSISNLNQSVSDGGKTIWKGGFSYSPIIYRENGETMNFVYDQYISTQSLALGFLGSDLNKYRFNSGQGQKPDGPINSVPNEPFGNHLFVNNVEVYNTPLGSKVITNKTYAYNEWPYNSNIKLSYTNLSGVDPGRPADGPAYRFNLFNINNFSKQQFTGITLTNPSGYTPGFFNEPIQDSFRNDVYKITRTGTYNINGGMIINMNVRDPNGGWSTIKLGVVIEKTNQVGFDNDVWQILTIANPTQLSQYGLGGVIDPINNSLSFDNNSGAKWRFRFDSNTSYVLNDGDYLRYSFYFIDIKNMYLNSDQLDIEFTDVFWNVSDTINKSTKYIYSSSYSSVDSLFTYETTNYTNDTLRFNDSASGYYYSASFVGNSVNYTQVKNKFNVQKFDLIKFGKFEDPGEYYEVISTRNFPGVNSSINYGVVLNKSINADLTLASNNFSILRPSPDETSVILEGTNISNIDNIDKALLISNNSSDLLKNNVGEIIKSLNTII